ncbi:unnamed protein product [Oikopleura dioica]|uniref:Peptidase S1 domain-containing protein n=1 Tax=Oikopleura dioica TaxID=34765 RepID=E4XJ73_OIKDI|nr:unnamed protein product [Oikopleura dioica]
MNVGKIMGGKKVDPGNFPWQAALALNMEIFCGGTLVSPKTVISAAHCLTNYQKPEDLFVSVGHISSSFCSKLCAAGFQNGMDTCQGDSGGPLVCDVEGRWTLTGVVSSGLTFGEKEIPGVYTRVAEYLEWIWTNSEIEPQKPQIGLQVNYYYLLC